MPKRRGGKADSSRNRRLKAQSNQSKRRNKKPASGWAGTSKSRKATAAQIKAPEEMHLILEELKKSGHYTEKDLRQAQRTISKARNLGEGITKAKKNLEKTRQTRLVSIQIEETVKNNKSKLTDKLVLAGATPREIEKVFADAKTKAIRKQDPSVFFDETTEALKIITIKDNDRITTAVHKAGKRIQKREKEVKKFEESLKKINSLERLRKVEQATNTELAELGEIFIEIREGKQVVKTYYGEDSFLSTEAKKTKAEGEKIRSKYKRLIQERKEFLKELEKTEKVTAKFLLKKVTAGKISAVEARRIIKEARKAGFEKNEADAFTKVLTERITEVLTKSAIEKAKTRTEKLKKIIQLVEEKVNQAKSLSDLNAIKQDLQRTNQLHQGIEASQKGEIITLTKEGRGHHEIKALMAERTKKYLELEKKFAEKENAFRQADFEEGIRLAERGAPVKETEKRVMRNIETADLKAVKDLREDVETRFANHIQLIAENGRGTQAMRAAYLGELSHKQATLTNVLNFRKAELETAERSKKATEPKQPAIPKKVKRILRESGTNRVKQAGAKREIRSGLREKIKQNNDAHKKYLSKINDKLAEKGLRVSDEKLKKAISGINSTVSAAIARANKSRRKEKLNSTMIAGLEKFLIDDFVETVQNKKEWELPKLTILNGKVAKVEDIKRARAETRAMEKNLGNALRELSEGELSRKKFEDAVERLEKLVERSNELESFWRKYGRDKRADYLAKIETGLASDLKKIRTALRITDESTQTRRTSGRFKETARTVSADETIHSISPEIPSHEKEAERITPEETPGLFQRVKNWWSSPKKPAEATEVSSIKRSLEADREESPGMGHEGRNILKFDKLFEKTPEELDNLRAQFEERNQRILQDLQEILEKNNDPIDITIKTNKILKQITHPYRKEILADGEYKKLQAEFYRKACDLEGKLNNQIDARIAELEGKTEPAEPTPEVPGEPEIIEESREEPELVKELERETESAERELAEEPEPADIHEIEPISEEKKAFALAKDLAEKELAAQEKAERELEEEEAQAELNAEDLSQKITAEREAEKRRRTQEASKRAEILNAGAARADDGLGEETIRQKGNENIGVVQEGSVGIVKDRGIGIVNVAEGGTLNIGSEHEMERGLTLLSRQLQEQSETQSREMQALREIINEQRNNAERERGIPFAGERSELHAAKTHANSIIQQVTKPKVNERLMKDLTIHMNRAAHTLWGVGADGKLVDLGLQKIRSQDGKQADLEKILPEIQLQSRILLEKEIMKGQILNLDTKIRDLNERANSINKTGIFHLVSDLNETYLKFSRLTENWKKMELTQEERDNNISIATDEQLGGLDPETKEMFSQIRPGVFISFWNLRANVNNILERVEEINQQHEE